MSEERASPDELLRRALFLGEQAIAVYMAKNRVDRETAMRALRARKQDGRRPSKVMKESGEEHRE